MENKNYNLKNEIQSLREELYDLIENRPWAKQEILKVSRQLDALILKFY